MQPINTNSIFSLFESNIDKAALESAVGEKVTDRLLLSGVIKGIEVFEIITANYYNKYGDSYLTVEPKIKRKYYNILFSYIDLLNLNNFKEIREVVLDLGYGGVIRSLEEFIEFYVKIEEYEKCAQIKKVVDICHQIEAHEEFERSPNKIIGFR